MGNTFILKLTSLLATFSLIGKRRRNPLLLIAVISRNLSIERTYYYALYTLLKLSLQQVEAQPVTVGVGALEDQREFCLHRSKKIVSFFIDVFSVALENYQRIL